MKKFIAFFFCWFGLVAILATGGCDNPPTFSKPPLPIGYGWRVSSVGVGLVLIIQNNSETDISVRLRCKNSPMRQEQTCRIDLPAKKTTEWGWWELSWKFEPGEEIWIMHEDYRTVHGRVPAY